MNAQLPGYFVYDSGDFTLVSEKEYRKWYSVVWKKKQPRFISKFINGKLYTAQGFYNGLAGIEDVFKPFSIFYMTGLKHTLSSFSGYKEFQSDYKKITDHLCSIEKLQHGASQPDGSERIKKVCIASGRSRCPSSSIYNCTYRKNVHAHRTHAYLGCACEHAALLAAGF